MAFSTKIKGHHHLQGNVQVYNVRIPVFWKARRIYSKGQTAPQNMKFNLPTQGEGKEPAGIPGRPLLKGLSRFHIMSNAKGPGWNASPTSQQLRRIAVSLCDAVCGVPIKHRKFVIQKDKLFDSVLSSLPDGALCQLLVSQSLLDCAVPFLAWHTFSDYPVPVNSLSVRSCSP